ncbi:MULTISPECIES: glycosyltransferase family 4 protein [unclassified Micromonospora]|uniref:glycosyltransferase family 4 protein n=1 Tax=unclassified Micromonospora TaxID=2617518 RepID=UPI00362CC1C8
MPGPDSRIRVAIDARYWRGSFQTGVERYILLLLEALGTVHEHVHTAVVVRDSERAAFPANAYPHVQVLTVSTRHAHALTRALRGFEPDLVHYPFDLPRRFDHPAVYTLHDPGRYLYPELMVKRIREEDNDLLRDQLHHPHLRAIVTVSQSSRTDIVNVFGEPTQPLTVVPNFIDSRFAAQLHHARTTARPPAQPFLLAVGVYIPTKNIPRLVRAFRLARQAAPDTVPPQLKLVGRLGWERGFPTNGAPDIAVLRHIDNQLLAQHFATCTAFLWPSFYEGFGLPVHEALAAGAPVLAADTPVNREIAGDLVTYTDPYDDDQMAKAIVTRCQQPPPSAQTVADHLAHYTAATAGTALLDTYRSAVDR